MVKSIIVDGDLSCCEALEALLKQYCPQVQITGIFSSGKDALLAIMAQPPDILFLDIEMPQVDGFELLEKLLQYNIEVIFTASSDKYALQAIQFQAVAYLLKPIAPAELQEAVSKVVNRLLKTSTEKLEVLLEKANHTQAIINKIAVPTLEGLQMVAVDTIISCASDSNYTVLYLKGKQKLVVSRTLKEMKGALKDYSFIRVHHSYLVNLNEVDKYLKGEGGSLVMSDGSHVDVSRSRREMLLQKLLHH